MPVKNSLTVTILALCLLAPSAEATNGYMSHGYGTMSKGGSGLLAAASWLHMTASLIGAFMRNRFREAC